MGGVLAPAAQDATPEAVSAAECQVEPRSAEFFQNLAATPAAAGEANAATATPEASLDPVDEATLTRHHGHDARGRRPPQRGRLPACQCAQHG
ncbi:MAG: hypothetical protein U0075_14625 [Thermomicrobiales bacterium]